MSKFLKWNILCFIILYGSSIACGQNIDSLLLLAKKEKSPTIQFNNWLRILQIYQYKKVKTGMNYASQQMLRSALATNNDTTIATAFLILGSISEDRADYSHALEYDFKSLKILEKLNYDLGICKISTQLAVVYKQLNNQKEAMKYLDKAEKYVSLPEVKITYLVRSVYSNKSEVYMNLKHNLDSALYFIKKAAAVTKKETDPFGYSRILSNYGSFYFKMGNFKLAEDYFQSAVSFSDSAGEKINLVQALNEYGKMLLIENKLSSAKKIVLRGLRECQNLSNPMGILTTEIMGTLSQVYNNLKVYDSAYYFSSLKNQYKDSIYNQQSLYAIDEVTFSQNIASIEEVQKKNEEAAIVEIARQKSLRNGFIFGFMVVLLFAGVFLSQRNKIKKGKKLSDELLLNILPEEVAEELKANGSAEAQWIEEVTVLFTDFKGFTEMAEKFSPKELVAEINECFSAFDYIMERNGVEKIKTIGDSYMAAGGLPTVNKTHASDVVNSALEIQAFMNAFIAKREAQGNLFFEIRIGVHTGPVVAGIVGVKKFAYDIWGDTVNTASRMESYGEAGKINISSTTYERIKDKFICTQRGKINAKGKGEIEMYFVDGRYERSTSGNSR